MFSTFVSPVIAGQAGNDDMTTKSKRKLAVIGKKCYICGRNEGDLPIKC